jgi:hypothetical protein
MSVSYTRASRHRTYTDGLHSLSGHRSTSHRCGPVMTARPSGSVPSLAARSLNRAAAWSCVHPQASRYAWRGRTW